MAPRKASVSGAYQTQLSTNTDNRVTKETTRGARGYRKFRSGMINIAPKAGEKTLYVTSLWQEPSLLCLACKPSLTPRYRVNLNSKTSLLSLPPEIRNHIWTYTLNNTMIQIYSIRSNSYKLLLKPSDRNNPMALLRTCRQIYYETAILPYKLNTITVGTVHRLTALVRHLRPYQYTRITSLELQLDHHNPEYLMRVWGPVAIAAQFPILEKLPELRRIEVRLFDYVAALGPGILSKLESGILSKLRACLPQVDVTLTTSEDSQRTYYLQWANKV